MLVTDGGINSLAQFLYKRKFSAVNGNGGCGCVMMALVFYTNTRVPLEDKSAEHQVFALRRRASSNNAPIDFIFGLYNR